MTNTRVDPISGEIVPTDGRGRKEQSISTYTKRDPVPSTQMAGKFYGATYLFDAIGEKLGIDQDLKQCFPELSQQILSIVYYQYEFYCHTVQTEWNYTEHRPYKGDTITEPRCQYIH